MNQPLSATVRRILLTVIGVMLLIVLAIFFMQRTVPSTGGLTVTPTQKTTTVVLPPRPPIAQASTDEVPGNDKSIPTNDLFEQIKAILGGSVRSTDEVLTIEFPRRDVVVFVDGFEVPTAAGVGHTMKFYRCPCGSMLGHGELLLYDYELNDVIDALRQDVNMKIVDTSPFLLGAAPNLVLLRYQCNGDPIQMAKILQSTFRWIGENRMKAD